MVKATEVNDTHVNDQVSGYVVNDEEINDYISTVFSEIANDVYRVILKLNKNLTQDKQKQVYETNRYVNDSGVELNNKYFVNGENINSNHDVEKIMSIEVENTDEFVNSCMNGNRCKLSQNKKLEFDIVNDEVITTTRRRIMTDKGVRFLESQINKFERNKIPKVKRKYTIKAKERNSQKKKEIDKTIKRKFEGKTSKKEKTEAMVEMIIIGNEKKKEMITELEALNGKQREKEHLPTIRKAIIGNVQDNEVIEKGNRQDCIFANEKEINKIPKVDKIFTEINEIIKEINEENIEEKKNKMIEVVIEERSKHSKEEKKDDETKELRTEIEILRKECGERNKIEEKLYIANKKILNLEIRMKKSEEVNEQNKIIIKLKNTIFSNQIDEITKEFTLKLLEKNAEIEETISLMENLNKEIEKNNILKHKLEIEIRNKENKTETIEDKGEEGLRIDEKVKNKMENIEGRRKDGKEENINDFDTIKYDESSNNNDDENTTIKSCNLDLISNNTIDVSSSNVEEKLEEMFKCLYSQFEDFQQSEIERKIKLENNIKSQLFQIRSMKHEEYLILNKSEIDSNDNPSNEKDNIINSIDRGIKHLCEIENVPMEMISEEKKIHKWPKNTILIATDSIFNQIEEKRLSKQYNVKVRAFNGASINDMYWYIHPLLEKEPDYVLLHVGSNDCTTSNADIILDELLELKEHIQYTLPNSTVILSQPIIRTDIPKANKTMNELICNFNQLDILKMDNSNLKREQLGKRGLHLSERGTRMLAMNIISLIRSF